MIQATGSDAGKSLIVAGLCRYFTNRDLRVLPFKPQNMSNNAAVTQEGGEIGRAQAVQAMACMVPPSVHMNPVLLKPEADTGAQLIVQGKVAGRTIAKDFITAKPNLLAAILESFQILERGCDLVIVEGAGSPAEVNLRQGDVANMGFAEPANVPVILLGDIDRGGVIASLVGTHKLLNETERARIKGFIINKFRGDTALFDDGIQIIEKETGWPCLGVVPWFNDANRLPAEDAVLLEAKAEKLKEHTSDPITIAVPRLLRIANFDDLDPLASEQDVKIVWVAPGEMIPQDADLILLPGSKATIADLAFLKHQGWDIDIKSHVRRGGHVLGLCGGYQMLGRMVHDPDQIEGEETQIEGLGLLDIETNIQPLKRLVNVTGRHNSSGTTISGYEMHMGETTGPSTRNPFLTVDGKADGAQSPDGLVAGTYIHGLFTNDTFRSAYLSAIKQRGAEATQYQPGVEQALDDLAEHLGYALDMKMVAKIAGLDHGAYTNAQRAKTSAN